MIVKPLVCFDASLHVKLCNDVAIVFAGLGWAFWIFCCPIAALSLVIRDNPQDEDDLHDDPLRPWLYKV